MWKKPIHQLKIIKRLLAAEIESNSRFSIQRVRDVFGKIRRSLKICDNGITDCDGHYDIDGTSFHEDQGVIISSDKRVKST